MRCNLHNTDASSPTPTVRTGGILKKLMVWLSVPVLLVAGCGWLIMSGLSAVAEPVNAAMDAIAANPACIAALGSPMQRGEGYKVNDYNTANGAGSANVDFDISGPNGSAQVAGRMVYGNGAWQPDGLVLSFADGKSVTLPEGASPATTPVSADPPASIPARTSPVDPSAPAAEPVTQSPSTTSETPTTSEFAGLVAAAYKTGAPPTDAALHDLFAALSRLERWHYVVAPDQKASPTPFQSVFNEKKCVFAFTDENYANVFAKDNGLLDESGQVSLLTMSVPESIEWLEGQAQAGSIEIVHLNFGSEGWFSGASDLPRIMRHMTGQTQ